eukprot:3314019-Prymnesium_polylepis.1
MRRSAGHMFPHGPPMFPSLSNRGMRESMHGGDDDGSGQSVHTATAGNKYRTVLVRAPRSSCSAS